MDIPYSSLGWERVNWAGQALCSPLVSNKALYPGPLCAGIHGLACETPWESWDQIPLLTPFSARGKTEQRSHFWPGKVGQDTVSAPAVPPSFLPPLSVSSRRRAGP